MDDPHDDIKADYERFPKSKNTYGVKRPPPPDYVAAPPKPREFTKFAVAGSAFGFGLTLGLLIGWWL